MPVADPAVSLIAEKLEIGIAVLVDIFDRGGHSLCKPGRKLIDVPDILQVLASPEVILRVPCSDASCPIVIKHKGVEHLMYDGVIEVRRRLLRIVYMQISVFILVLKINGVQSDDVAEFRLSLLIFGDIVSHISQGL